MDIPYCGAAPLPGELLGRWNLDPVLIGMSIVLAALQVALFWRNETFERRSKLMTLAVAWALLAALLISPLCALTSALFSARVAHHVILIAIVAPLFVLSLPERYRTLAFSGGAIGTFGIVHAAILWFWHAPAPYEAALASHAVFWVMELSLLGSAMLVWIAVLSPRAAFGPTLLVLLTTIIQTGLLGAVITFARTPLYAPHVLTTEPWGLTALADQQLAGLLMWVPAALPYLAAALILMGTRLASAESRREQAS